MRIINPETEFENRFFLVNRNYDYPEVFLRDSELFWRMRGPQRIESKFFEKGVYQINSLGMRGNELVNNSDTRRIAVLGNSCAFGWQVPQESSFVEIVVSNLNNHSKQERFVALNAGIPGYSSYQGKIFFQNVIAPLKPEYVLILFGWNDHWASAENIIDSKRETAGPLILYLQNILGRLKVYQFLRKNILSVIEPPLAEMVVKDGYQNRVPLGEFGNNLLAICRSATTAGVKPILLTSPIPSLATYYPQNRVSRMHEIHAQYNLEIRRIAFENDFELVDLANEFDKFDDLFDNAEKDPIHFNSKGHSVAAQAILKTLRDNFN